MAKILGYVVREGQAKGKGAYRSKTYCSGTWTSSREHARVYDRLSHARHDANELAANGATSVARVVRLVARPSPAAKELGHVRKALGCPAGANLVDFAAQLAREHKGWRETALKAEAATLDQAIPTEAHLATALRRLKTEREIEAAQVQRRMTGLDQACEAAQLERDQWKELAEKREQPAAFGEDVIKILASFAAMQPFPGTAPALAFLRLRLGLVRIPHARFV